MTMDGSPPASGSFDQLAAPSLIGQVLDGRYRLVKKLGEGGMGEVYAAEHVHIEKRFAVKLLRQEIVSNKEAVVRFRQEARSASSIGHRNIIAIVDFGELPDGRIYMCMELLNGAPLNDLIKEQLSHERLVNILIQTGHGLAAAHAKGIIHRDMKPENVFVTWTAGGEDIPKLLDFGIAKVAGNEGQNNLTRTGTIFGTPYYMAPEQALGNAVDARTDVYAMGVIIYEVFSGSLPFQGESFMGILTQHITTDPEPVVQRAAKAGRPLPPGIAEIVQRCMQKDPNNRFSSMDELVQALVNVYRVVAGAGMSSYMEAFPQSSSAMSSAMSSASASGPAKFTPPPSSLGMGTGNPGQGMHPGHGRPSGPMGTPMPPGVPPPPQGGFLPSGGHQGVAPASQHPPHPASQSGPYGHYDPSGSAVIQPPRSKVGLIFAVIAVLAVVAGGVGFLIIGSKKPQGAVDAGIAVAVVDAGAGAGTGVEADARTVLPVDAGVASADAAVAVTPDAALPVTPDAALPATPDAGVTPPPQLPDAGAVPAIVEVEVTFSVTPANAKLYDGSRQMSSLRVKVNPKKPKKITIKASGYESKTVTVTGRDDRMSVVLTKAAAPPPSLDCSGKLIDATNPRCLEQYCKKHSTAMECGA
jgi:eukaryotic-like serine/threonine-protein kinase